MALIIAFVGQKGGSGKTTSAVSVACEWQARGRRVLLVDADPQGSARTWAAVAGEGGQSAPTTVGMGAGMHRPEQLPRLAPEFDVIVIDVPGRLGEVTRAALMVSDLAVIPCGPTPMDVWALQATLDLVDEARAVRPELRCGVLITKATGRSSLAARTRTALEVSGVRVFRASLSHRVAYQEALAVGRGPSTFAPKSAAAAEVRAVADEIESWLLPTEEIDDHAVQEAVGESASPA